MQEKDKLFIGIDPGVKGAIVSLTKNRIVAIHDMPVVTKKVSGKSRSYVDADALTRLAKTVMSDYGDIHVFLEQVSAGPGEGAVGAFSFGRSFGVVIGVFTALGHPPELVTPQGWKHFHGLIRKEKDSSRLLCLEKYPLQTDVFRLKKHVDRADAALIAEYGRHLYI